jgi:hypothetical protein
MIRHDTRTDGENWGNRMCLSCATETNHYVDCTCDCHYICVYGPKESYPIDMPESFPYVGKVQERAENAEKNLERKLVDDKKNCRRLSTFLGDEGIPKA